MPYNADLTVAVIGASGKTGSRVVRQLTELEIKTRPLSRQTSPAFDWANPQAWPQALTGVDSIYITYHPDLALPQAKDDIAQLITVAKAQGVKHLVLLSGRGEDGAQQAEKQVIQSGLNWNIVRASWFMQNFSESFMLDGILNGELVLPHPQATEPFIDIDDIAEIAVAALTKPELANRLFEVTGPELLSFAQCIELLSLRLNRPVGLTTIALEDYIAAAQQQPDLPEGFDWLIHELFSTVLDGRNEFTTDTINKVLGRPATRFEQYLEKTAENGVWRTRQRESLPC
ncbi:SDR family oxidoreductase [Halioxenophilus aromaticivorans]|uniref:NAD(P)H-binding protein n=1 Tax=Halioxenophilus aromaticivorans TaxID=1306992 RepID=A0AAV3U5X3_9ALTE